MQKTARQIANQGTAGLIQRMQGFSRPVIDPKFAELLSSNAFGRQIEDVDRSLKPAVESITESLNPSYFKGFEPLLEQTRRAVPELVRSFRARGVGYERLGAAYKDLSDRDVDEVVIRLLRMTMIQLPTARALTDTDDHESGFNRHGTLHGKPAFFSPSDCVAGLLLLGAWVRELAWWQDHHPEAITRG